MISGAFSLTRQAIQLGYLPAPGDPAHLRARRSARSTSRSSTGCCSWPWSLLVLGFGSSSSLADAYGIAVTGDDGDRLGPAASWSCAGCGSWSLSPWRSLIAAAARARRPRLPRLERRQDSATAAGSRSSFGVGDLHAAVDLEARARRCCSSGASRGSRSRSDPSSRARRACRPTRVPGTAIFMTSTPTRVPHALLHNLKHNKVLHERIVFLTVVTHDVPLRRLPTTASRWRRSAAVLPHVRVLRLQGGARRPRDPRGRRPQRLPVRHDGHVVLRVARDAHPHEHPRAWRSGASTCSRR